jgi:hypothetical protein
MKSPVEGTVRGRVEYVSDDGMVVLLLPDGQRRTTTIPRRAVAGFRRLAALDREFDLDLAR